MGRDTLQKRTDFGTGQIWAGIQTATDTCALGQTAAIWTVFLKGPMEVFRAHSSWTGSWGRDVGAINGTPGATPPRAGDGMRGGRREPFLSLVLGASKDLRAPWLLWVSPSIWGCCSWLPPPAWVGRRFMEEGEPALVPGSLCEFNEEQVMFLRSLWASSGEGKARVRFRHLLCSGQRLVYFLQHWDCLQLD